MNSLREYFHTDWGAMTISDWIGLVVTVVVFFLMIWAYVYVFHPKNREKLESQKYIPIDEERDDAEDRK